MTEVKHILRQWQFYATTICAAIIVIVVTFPRGVTSSRYLYQVGRPWAYEDLVSPIDFPILKTEAELLKEKEDKATVVVPCFQYDETVWNGVLKSFKELLETDSENTDVITELLKVFNEVYDTGILVDRPETDVILVRRGKHAFDLPSSSVFAISQVESYVRQQIVSDSLTVEDVEFMAQFPFEDYIKSNLIYNAQKTEEIHRQAYQDISPTKGMFYSGGLIVSQGEIVTPYIAQLLDSYKQEDARSAGGDVSVAGLAIGRFLLAFIILASMIAAIYFTDFRHSMRWRDFYYILMLLIFLGLSTGVVHRISATHIFLLPYPVLVLYLMSFYRRYVAFPVYSIMLLPVLLLVQNGVCIYFINLVAGIATLVSFRRFNKGWHQFVCAFYIFISLLVSYIAFSLLWKGDLDFNILSVSWMMAISALFVVLAYPMVFLFEKMFSLVSQRRLAELGEINNRLLREMSQKAPGSFQHSLQVANLAGEAAHELDVNEALVRAGALYHDIGKMKNPLCFVENQPAGMDYHAGLSPEDSAQQIIRHVDDGVELAKKNNLPQEVVDFILTHHAQSVARFFYTTYVKNGGDPANMAPFSYHGNLPETEEQVIVMMADSIEAASRTLKDYSEDSIRKLVEGIISSRLNELQLVNANISLRDLTRLKEIFVRKVSQIYHERITYPKL